MIFNSFFSLEDPAHPLLGPTLLGLRKIGMCQSKRKSIRVIYNCFLVFASVYVITEYIELYCVRSNLAAALKNLSKTILTHVSVVKAITFIIWQKDWMSVINFVSSLELYQLIEKDNENKIIIQKYIKYSRTVTYYYWVLVLISIIIYSFAPLAYYFFSVYINTAAHIEETPFPEIMSSWVPFNKTSVLGRCLLTILHIVMGFNNAFILAMYDTNAVVLMVFFAGQLEILKLNCKRIFETELGTNRYNESVQRIRKCHHHHILLVKNFKVLNSLLSPVMFFYAIICSVMMCSSLGQLTAKDVTTMDKLWTAEYLIAQVFQLFLYCWHSHKVLYMSVKVNEGVYSSEWWSQQVRLRRNVILLGGQLNKNIQFTAGPFVNLSVVTFLAIIKGAYSYYTLLSSLGD